MSEHVQELIDKIKQEGVQAGEEVAAQLEKEAKQKARDMIADAKRQAEEIIQAAKEEQAKLEESTRASLQQASRDTVLSLRQEIEKILQKIVQKEVADSLTGEQLCTIISAVISESIKDEGMEADIHVAVSKKDLEVLEKGFLAKMQKKIKQPIKLQASEDIEHGFTISYDGGKSCFDFTDASLGHFLGSFVNT